MWNTDKPYDRDCFLPNRREREDIDIDQIADEQERKHAAIEEVVENNLTP